MVCLPKLLKQLMPALFLVGVTTADDAPRVTSPIGVFRGKEMVSGRQKAKFYAFTGIPYARAPVGGLRFMVSCIKTRICAVKM